MVEQVSEQASEDEQFTEVRETHRVHPQAASAIIRATRPIWSDPPNRGL